MSSNDHSAQDYLNLPEAQVGNSSVPTLIPDNNDNNINYHVGISNSNNTVTSDTFEFYLPLPNDTIYRIHQRVQYIYQPQQPSQTFDTIPNSQAEMLPPNSQVYSNNIYENVIPSNETISEDIEYTNQTYNDF
ncbi:unnamed protein product [Rhizophagus irregularis]|uniref:Uncharacterized protein n=1 Tax=Rhizophagus irregularis TaxID=588596 RepID=A0A2I1H7X5_9GLOM|nr:hypothetical protein RhiirA4_474090 [Rhizophagus irregularis]CAB4433585.1 unnamed protein product [Rhizophagus irregularis]